MLSDEQIIARALKGSAKDFRELMRRHQNAVYRLAYRILKRREDAEDVVQETFLRVHQNLAAYAERGKFWPWARRIAMNICLKRLPSEVPVEEVGDLLESAQAPEDPVETEVLRRIEAGAVGKAIAGLPATYRAVVVLRYEEDLSYKEIAELVSESVSAVETRLHRAKRMLAERLAVVINDEL